MQPVYSRIHRSSIYEPATIHDFPFEVLANCLKYLNPQDLVAPSLACRTWYHAAAELIYSHISLLERDRERLGSFICGLHLRNIVFGAGSCKIKRLGLDMSQIGREYIPLIAQSVAPTLSSLKIDIYGSLNHYETLDIFLNQCLKIRNICLDHFNFGDDPDLITQTIKDGFARLRQLDFLWSEGDISMFVDRCPIHKLQLLKYWSDRSPIEESEIISGFAINYRSLTRVILQSEIRFLCQSSQDCGMLSRGKEIRNLEQRGFPEFESCGF
jgi:hypothetical protein